MDTRTAQLLRALDPTSAELLVALLEESRSEKALLREFDGLPQATGHRKLQRLGEVGLIRQDPGDTSRGAPWVPVAPHPTAQLLTALLSLVDALETIDQSERKIVRDRLAVSKSGGSGLRLVKDSPSQETIERGR